MWKTSVILLIWCFIGTTLATPIVGLKKNMEIRISEDDIRRDDVSEEITPPKTRAEIAMATLNLPSNATSIRADIVDGFSCKNRDYGYYADVDNDCQIFHVCMPVVYADGKENTFRWSFICPEQTVFSQDSFTCMREEDMSFGCEDSVKYYELNRNFGIIDSSMEIHSNEAEIASDKMMGDTNMEESIIEKEKPQKPSQQQNKIDAQKPEKIQKRVDELKPEIAKPVQGHKKKNKLRKTPVRKVISTTTVIPTATEQVITSTTPTTTTTIPLEVEITTAKMIEKLTTKYQRFTRRPDIIKENKKKTTEQVQKPEAATVGPVKDSAKKPFKTDSITIQKRKRPQLPSNLKHKFNGEEKPLKNILKTSEITKITQNQEQNLSIKLNKKNQIRPPIPEPILIRVEEQPAEQSKPPKNIQPTQQSKPSTPLLIPEVMIPLTQEPVTESSQKNNVEKLPSITNEPVANDESSNNEFLVKNISPPLPEEQKEDDKISSPTATSVDDSNLMTAINVNNENISKQESTKIPDQQKHEHEFDEKVMEESLTSKKEELSQDHTKNENNSNNNNDGNQDITHLNNNKNDIDGNSLNNNQSGIDQQSMIINLISSLVNAENSKVDDVPDKNENSQFILPPEPEQQKEEQQEHAPEQGIVMDNKKLHEIQQQEQQSNNDEFLEMTTSNIELSNDHQLQDSEQIKNSDQSFKITSTNNKGDDEPAVTTTNSEKVTEQNQFDSMQKFIHQQHELYNHMTHIPVKLLMDDQFENIQTKGDLSNSDALNVIQRIEQLLQNEVKDENQSLTPEGNKPTSINQPDVISELQKSDRKEDTNIAEVQQSSEEIKPIYHRSADPIELSLLKDNVMSVDENTPIIKDTEKTEKLILHNTAESIIPNVAISVEEQIKDDSVKDLNSASEKPKPEHSKETYTVVESLPTEKIVSYEPMKEQTLKSQPLKIEVLETKQEVIPQALNDIETSKTDSVKEEPIVSTSENKSESESIPLQIVTESSITKIEKLKDSIVLEPQLTDPIRTSSRSLKYKTRIIDPRKRRFLFKADA